MLRDSLGGSQDDDDDDDADFVSTAQIETFFTGSKALHVEAALTGRQVAHLLPIASHELLPGRLAVNTRYECTADVLATVAAHSEATQTPMVYVSRTIKQIRPTFATSQPTVGYRYLVPPWPLDLPPRLQLLHTDIRS
eukprot:COSAG01_NODE_18622_length_1063_cov_17.201245_1_plen_138_part_00